MIQNNQDTFNFNIQHRNLPVNLKNFRFHVYRIVTDTSKTFFLCRLTEGCVLLNKNLHSLIGQLIITECYGYFMTGRRENLHATVK